MKLKKAFPFIAMLLVILMGSCKKDDVTGVRPVVNSTYPIKNATSISVKAKITASFSAAMDASTITTATFTLLKGTETVAGAVTYTGTTATFTPAANLAANTVFTATITTGAKDMVGTSMAKDYTWTFTSGAALDETAPTISSTDPINNATGVALNKVAAIVFSEAMNPTTINATTFTLKQGTTAIAGTVAYSGTTATFTPSASLVSATYTATITTDAKDLAGNALAANTVWTFTTVNIPDTTLPVVNSTDPLNTSIGVPLNKVVGLAFSEAMNSSTINATTFTLKQGTTAVAGTVAYSGTSATFTPSTILAANTIYTATITTGAKDLAGNALAANTVWTFTTNSSPDLIPPVISSTDPLNNAINVALTKVVAIVFSEPMNPSTISASTFTLKQGTTAIAGTVAYSGTTATFTPSAPLSNNSIYTATITTGAKDLAGNALAFNTVWTFSTPDTTPPVANATDPLNNVTGVAVSKALTITFSEAMDPSTLNASTFILMRGTTAVAGTVSYSGTTATFTPSAPLISNTTYTATITTGAKDLAGNPLAANIVWTFTTIGGAGIGPAIVNLGTAGNFVILAKTAISNVPTSAITGDLGLSPAAESFITGFSQTDATGYATAPEVTGKLYAADMAPPTPINLTTAVADMMTAYTDAAGRPTPDFTNLLTGNIGGQTLTPGLYNWTTGVTAPASLTISGGPNDVWIFQIAGNLSLSTSVNITLSGGAQPKNIFWQVAGSVTLGATSHFEGIILSQTGINLLSGASMNGRALAQTAVTLISNTVTKP